MAISGGTDRLLWRFTEGGMEGAPVNRRSFVRRTLAQLHYRHTVCMEFLPIGDPVRDQRNARLEAICAMQDASLEPHRAASRKARRSG